MESGMRYTSFLRSILKVNPAALEAKYREREALLEQRVEPPFAIRLDGVSFSKRLEGYTKPRDIRVHEALVEACAELLDKLNATICYTGSDELNLIIDSEPPYGGRLEKLVSISAGIASSIVSLRLSRSLYFDSRIVPLGRSEFHEYILYRVRVVFNNYVNTLLLSRGVRVERLDAGLNERLEMLRSFGVNPLEPLWASLGTCVTRVWSERIIDGISARRRRIVAASVDYCLSSSNETR